jgi:putative hydrolase of the HAD superfamily
VTALRTPKVRAVFFDIGNVLLRFSAREVVRRIAWEVRGSPVKLARYLWNSNLGERVEKGELAGEELYALFRKELGYKKSYAQFRRLWCDHFTLNRASYAILKRTAKKVPTYLLSNTNALHIDFIRDNYRFPALVKGAILSHEVGLRKPSPGIYRAALKLSRTKAAQTVFVDDLEANVEGARRVGFVAIRFKNAADLRRRFRELGL